MADCGGDLNADHGGVIKSPNYPNNYPENEDCNWYIRSTGSVILLNITELDTEYKADYLTVGGAMRLYMYKDCLILNFLLT